MVMPNKPNSKARGRGKDGMMSTMPVPPRYKSQPIKSPVIRPKKRGRIK